MVATPVVEGFIGLFLIAALVAMLARQVNIPYTVALVCCGIALHALFNLVPELPHIAFTPDLVLVVFLPALLFESSFQLNLEVLAASIRPIFFLAIPGVIITTAVIGGVVHWGTNLPLLLALLFGSIVSATDPIAVVALFKKLGVPRRLAMIIEGESLFNDGTALVLFQVLLGVVGLQAVGGAGQAALPTTVQTILPLLGQFAWLVLGGAATGLVTGWLFSRLTSLVDDHLIEMMLSTVLAYGTYLLAEKIGVSGVIGVVVAGIVLGNDGRARGMSPRTREVLDDFWEYVAFAINSLVFLLLGSQIELGMLGKNLGAVGLVVLAALLARAVVVYGAGLVLAGVTITPELKVIGPTRQLVADMQHRWQQRKTLTSDPARHASAHLKNRLHQPLLPLQWQHLIFWSGLRGALSMALVLSLPSSLPNRSLIVTLTYGLVLLTLLVQGITIEPLLRWLQLRPDASGHATRQARKHKRPGQPDEESIPTQAPF